MLVLWQTVLEYWVESLYLILMNIMDMVAISNHFFFHPVSVYTVYIATVPLPVTVTIKFLTDFTRHPNEASVYTSLGRISAQCIYQLWRRYQFVKSLTKSNLVHGWSSTFAGQRCATRHWHIRNVRRTAMYSADGKARICYASRFAHVASRFIIVILKSIKFKSCSSGVLETENCYISESHISYYYDFHEVLDVMFWSQSGRRDWDDISKSFVSTMETTAVTKPYCERDSVTGTPFPKGWCSRVWW